MFKTIQNCALIFIIIVLLGFLLMCVTYSLPNENVHDHIIKDVEVLKELHPSIIPNDSTTLLDVFTDSIIITELLDKTEYDSNSKNAMAVYEASPSDFNSIIEGNKHVTFQYPRYWHGNLVVYHTFFNFIDYDGIKILQLFCELILIIGILKMMIDNNLKCYTIPFIISLFFIHQK